MSKAKASGIGQSLVFHLYLLIMFFSLITVLIWFLLVLQLVVKIII